MLTLKHSAFRNDGIFGALRFGGDEAQFCVTLEHAFAAGHEWVPIIPPDTYTCVRGLHRLHGMDHDFETFEITGVEGHSKLLFHWGNWQTDSEGCILLGEKVAEGVHNGEQHEMVTNSRATFATFMQRLVGIDEFKLTVED